MSVKIEKSQFSSQYDNVTSGEYYIYGSLGGYIYKSYESMFGASAAYKDHIKPLAEANVGAHYYVQSPYSTNYSSASATIDFNSVELTHANRNAYISLGIITEGSKYYSFDIGFTYDVTTDNGSEVGWVPCAIAHGGTTPTPTISCTDSTVNGIWKFYKNKYLNVRYCDIKIEVSKTSENDIVTVTYTYRSDTSTLEQCILTYKFNAGAMFTSSSSDPKLRFMRFISLVPSSGDGTKDDKDNSVLAANLSNLKLGSSNWTASQIDYAWSVQGANITKLKISTLSGTTANADSIRIYHQYQLH